MGTPQAMEQSVTANSRWQLAKWTNFNSFLFLLQASNYWRGIVRRAPCTSCALIGGTLVSYSLRESRSTTRSSISVSGRKTPEGWVRSTARNMSLCLFSETEAESTETTFNSVDTAATGPTCGNIPRSTAPQKV